MSSFISFYILLFISVLLTLPLSESEASNPPKSLANGLSDWVKKVRGVCRPGQDEILPRVDSNTKRYLTYHTSFPRQVRCPIPVPTSSVFLHSGHFYRLVSILRFFISLWSPVPCNIPFFSQLKITRHLSHSKPDATAIQTMKRSNKHNQGSPVNPHRE